MSKGCQNMENGVLENGCCKGGEDNSFSKDEMIKKLTPLQYQVTQEQVTERQFSGKYYKLKDNGMYACIVCGEELFSSQSKYDSGCGWPAFWDVTNISKVKFKPDLSHVGCNLLLLALKPGLARTAVSCACCGAHLGHVFDDGPKPTGKRYCINSAALNFRKIESLSSNEEQGSLNSTPEPPKEASLSEEACAKLNK